MCKRVSCKYISLHLTGNQCDYSSRTGKTRTGQLSKKMKLPANSPVILDMLEGNNCPFYQPRGKDEKPLPAVMATLRYKPAPKPKEKKEYVPPASEERLILLYEQGLSDAKIAEELGIKEFHVNTWRKKRKLPSNFGTHRLKNEDRLMELYKLGMSDREISKETGTSCVTIYKWRSKHALAPNWKHERMDYKRVQELYDQGLNDKQISRETGHASDSIRLWRKRNGLESNFTKQQKQT